MKAFEGTATYYAGLGINVDPELRLQEAANGLGSSEPADHTNGMAEDLQDFAPTPFGSNYDFELMGLYQEVAALSAPAKGDEVVHARLLANTYLTHAFEATRETVLSNPKDTMQLLEDLEDRHASAVSMLLAQVMSPDKAEGVVDIPTIAVIGDEFIVDITTRKTEVAEKVGVALVRATIAELVARSLDDSRIEPKLPKSLATPVTPIAVAPAELAAV